jgi:hypothetical protein
MRATFLEDLKSGLIVEREGLDESEMLDAFDIDDIYIYIKTPQ